MILLAAPVIGPQFAGRALATTETWISSGGGNWSNASDWNPQKVPGNGDTALVIGNAAASSTVTYDYTGTVTLNSLTVNNFPGAETLAMTSTGTLLATSGGEYIGDSGTSTLGGTGEIDQSVGTNNAATLFLGVNAKDTGTYSLTSIGTLTAANETIGDFGTGSFIQIFATNSISNALVLGSAAGSTGYYSLDGDSTAALAANSETIGASGNGTFIQSDGINTLGASGSIDIAASPGSTGLYSLSRTGALASNILAVGGTASSSSMIQSGGSGTFEMDGGSLSATYVLLSSSGTWNQYGGTASIVFLTLNPGATCSVSGGIIGGIGVNNSITDNSTITQSGGVVQGSIFTVGDGVSASYSLSNNGTLSTSFETIGTGAGASTFVQSGGEHNAGGDIGGLEIGGNGATGTYVMTGGTLNCPNAETVEAGAFIQSGGVNTVGGDGEMTINGSYSLSGTGYLQDENNEYIGDSTGTAGAPAHGTFVQTGGINGMYVLILGAQPGDTGSYSLQGGSLDLVNGPEQFEIVGNGGSATFNQTGGTNNFSSPTYLAIGGSPSNGGPEGRGEYSLSGSGVISGSQELVGAGGAGTFIQSGGNNSLYYEVDIGIVSGSTGQYLLTGGSLTTPTMAIGSTYQAGGVGTFSLSGTGQVFVTSALTIAPGSSYQQSGGSAAIAQISSAGSVSVTGGKLQLAVNGGQSKFATLSITSSGALDITNNSVIIDYGGGPDPIASVAAWIKSGFNGGAWNGDGIVSSLLPAEEKSYGIGFADAADPGNPAQLPSGEIEIKYTLLGDANLDGSVNGTDFAILAANFNKSVTSWDQGDFNYDGSVNGTDFADLAANFNQGASQADIAALDSFAAAHGLMADVPEPASVGFLAVAAGGLLRRRRSERLYC